MAALSRASLTWRWLSDYVHVCRLSYQNGSLIRLFCLHWLSTAAIMALGPILLRWVLKDSLLSLYGVTDLVRLLHASVTLLPQHPVGLKLNVAVAELFVSVFTYSLRIWLSWLSVLAYNVQGPLLLATILVSLSLGGGSLLLALSIDCLTIMTLHMKACHLVMATIFRAMLHAIHTLVLLFAGKKHNPFRERIDSYASSRVHILIGN